ncbi:hypothetical protein MTR67_043359 [Solanum verrucosum]|uniref:Uncharacterized protein n=1 Tax=Solanum verrucosum TaxID=315347 RepID=A0AAF0UQ47_SOLVR|nr:hypothetical protein MTR67_043359 [Solanum verrucosum]
MLGLTSRVKGKGQGFLVSAMARGPRLPKTCLFTAYQDHEGIHDQWWPPVVGQCAPKAAHAEASLHKRVWPLGRGCLVEGHLFPKKKKKKWRLGLEEPRPNGGGPFMCVMYFDLVDLMVVDLSSIIMLVKMNYSMGMEAKYRLDMALRGLWLYGMSMNNGEIHLATHSEGPQAPPRAVVPFTARERLHQRGQNSGEDSGKLAGAQANQNVKEGANEHYKEARKTIPQQSKNNNSPTKLACESDINSKQNNNDGDSQNATNQQEKEKELNQNYNKETEGRKRNNNHTQNLDQGKSKNVQMQVKQIKDNQNQQILQGRGMNAKPLTIIERESAAQISKPPPPVIDVDDDHCLNNDTPSPVIPYVVADEVCRGRMVVKKNPTNMKELEPKGRGLTQVPATTVKAPQKMLN